MSGTGPWTFDTSGASLEEVQALVESLSVTPPAGFDGEITVTVETTTAEAADGRRRERGLRQGVRRERQRRRGRLPFTVTVNDSTPEVVAATKSQVDEDDLVPEGSDQSGSPMDTGSITVDFFGDQPDTADLMAAFAFTGGISAGTGAQWRDDHLHAHGRRSEPDGQHRRCRYHQVEITGATENGNGNVTYNYKVTLLEQMDHQIGDGVESTFDFTANFTVTDSDGDPANGSFDVTVVDDVPQAMDDCVEVQENTPISYDLMFVLDNSGSMNNDSGISGQTRLQAAGEALKELIDALLRHQQRRLDPTGDLRRDCGAGRRGVHDGSRRQGRRPGHRKQSQPGLCLNQLRGRAGRGAGQLRTGPQGRPTSIRSISCPMASRRPGPTTASMMVAVPATA